MEAGKRRSRGGRACISCGRAPGFMNTGVFAHGAPIYAARRHSAAYVLGSARVGAGRRGACRCLVTRRQSPRGLNTVCTSVVRELDPMLARTNYQLIFHERGPGLRAPTTEYRLAKPVEKLVIQLPAERTRFISFFFPCRGSFSFFLFFFLLPSRRLSGERKKFCN